ncbi:hypothetical protein L210DRAFT_3645755 [Boletus edulis BED1]|uniref:Uncharacterized protein n=1 Tax=Boletus edulis BED1 TaxID=1328754 RepID=A0AAD4BUD9_BOLED|nr:hypothetical protein L210DRAFT_3645755 [Boletus edulis BED1]
MQLFNVVLSLVLLASSVLAQSTQLLLPRPGSKLTGGSSITVQVGMGGYPENIDNVALVISLSQCHGGQCDPASSFLGNVLYQGVYTPIRGQYYANYTVKVPQYFTGKASLNVLNLFLVGAEYEPIVDYLNETVTVV